MSLFPAFDDEPSSTCHSLEKPATTLPESWLHNASFPPSTSSGVVPLTTKDATESKLLRETAVLYCSHGKKKKKHKNKDKRSSKDLLQNDYSGKRKKYDTTSGTESFIIDKKRSPNFITLDKLMGPDVPRYARAVIRPLGQTHYRRKKAAKKSRYYNVKRVILDPAASSQESIPEWQHDTQAELKHTTEELNRTVSRDPGNVSAWLKLVELQPSMVLLSNPDSTINLSPSERRGVIEKQIAILDKALHHNPSSAELIRERYGLASMVVPGDSLVSQLRSLLELNPCLLVGWLELARIERSHLASCSVPQVTDVFADAMQAVNARRRKESSVFIEETILELALACGIFLQEAGLHEQVWTLLRLYTEPSLRICGDINRISELQAAADRRAAALEEEAAIKEDELLASGLPSSELWLRIEHLRETAHFLPAPDCTWAREGDPQRMVYPEDLALLAQPITLQFLGLRVAVNALVVLGCPPLPFTHAAMQVISQHTSVPNLGLLASAWPLFAPDVVNPCGWLDTEAVYFSSTSGCGPLIPGPGGHLYRSLLQTVFHKYALCLPDIEGTALFCWWIRLETLFARFSSKSGQLPHVKNAAKYLLKRPENRDKLQLFHEYALLEAALAQSTSVAEKILLASIGASKNTVIQQHRNKANMCRVYQTLAEIWAIQGQLSKVCTLLCGLVLERIDPLSGEPVQEDVVKEAAEKFDAIISDGLSHQNGNEDIGLIEVLTEDFLVTCTSCYAWLLAVSQNVWCAGAMLERTIGKLESSQPGSIASRQREGLYCTYISLIEYHGRKNPGGAGLLSAVVHRAVTDFPNNASLLALRAKISVSWGQDSKSFSMSMKCNLLSSIIKLLALEHRIQLQESAEEDALQIKTSNVKCHPKIVAQYERLVNRYDCRHCPLIWRMYLRYVGRKAPPEVVKSTFYKAIEDCPWVKALYLQGARLLPEELGNIQDLLVEKELRLHVAPEELELLRDN